MPVTGCGPPPSPNPASLLDGGPRLKGLEPKHQHTLVKGGTHHPHHSNNHHYRHNNQQTYKHQRDRHQIRNSQNSSNNESAVDSRARQVHDTAAYHDLESVSDPSLCGPGQLPHHHFVPYRVETAPSQRRSGHLYELERLPAALRGRHGDSSDEPLVPVRVLVCCLCGALVAVLLLYLLYEYVRQQTELNSPSVDVDNLELFNAVYSHRVAHIIRTAAAEVPPPRTPYSGWTQGGGGVAMPHLTHKLGSGVKLQGLGGSWGVAGSGSRRGLAAELVGSSAVAVALGSAKSNWSSLYGGQARKLCSLIPPSLGEYIHVV